MKAIKTIGLIVILSVLLVVVAVANQLTPSRPVAAAVEPAVAVAPTPMLAPAPAPVPTLVDYEAMTTRVLRPMARDKKIPHWKKLTKAELIAALREV